MPPFILDKGANPARFDALDAFTRGYVAAMFYTSTGDDGDDDLGAVNVSELSREALAKIVSECQRFQSANAALLETAYAHEDYDAAAAGGSFWYTRNGYSGGFWELSLTDGLGVALTDSCAAFPGAALYRGDDGSLHLA